MSQNPPLALCVIFRDNEKTIDALLESICRARRPNGDLVGYAFDEYVFVDTGCTDRTREKIAAALGLLESDIPTVPGERFHGFAVPVDGAVTDARWSPTPKVTFARFEWVDDFAAARNFSYSLASADWRMYLDTDDVLPNAAGLRPTFWKCLAGTPDLNCAVMPYQYDPQTLQWVRRISKASAGYTWRGRVHEMLYLPPGTPQRTARLGVFAVQHQHDPSRILDQVQRNVALAARDYDNLREAPPSEPDRDVRFGKAAQTLGRYHMSMAAITEGEARAGHAVDAIRLIEEAVTVLGDIDLAATSLLELGLMCQNLGRPMDARGYFLRAMDCDPAAPDPVARLALLHIEEGRPDAAHRALEHLRAMPKVAVSSVTDQELVGFTLPFAAMHFYVGMGAEDSAREWANRIEPAYLRDPTNRPRAAEAAARLNVLHAFNQTKAFVEMVAASDDTSQLSRQSMDAITPRFLQEDPRYKELVRWVEHRNRHLSGWDEYRKAYNEEEEPEAYDPQQVDASALLALPRAQVVINWARQRKGDAPIRVLCIGPRECHIERALLEANPNIHLTLAEASELGSAAAQALRADFPERVILAPVRDHGYDWPAGPFDLVYALEVVEHLSGDAATSFGHMLARAHLGTGEVICTFPHGPHWLVYDHVRPDAKHSFWGHVRALTPVQVAEALRVAGASASARIELIDSGSVIYLHLHRGAEERLDAVEWLCRNVQEDIAIVVPGTPQPFDPEAHLRGHIGGSEEAVIHLARELAATGRLVTVYCPRPPFGAHVGLGGPSHLVMDRNVLYRPIEEFDAVEAEGAGCVLFWRMPNYPLPEKRTYRAHLWLHDTHYGATKAQYDRFDSVLVLSQFHEDTVNALDLKGGGTKFRRFMNGIDAPALARHVGTPKVPGRVVYSSSPDRGLERLLEAWPAVRARRPDATLDIYYSWDAVKKHDPALYARLVAKVEALTGTGVTYRGGVDHETLHRALAEAEVWAYPTQFEEIYCISAVKAAFLGCRIVSTFYAAIEEVLDSTAVLPPGYGYLVPYEREEGEHAVAAGIVEALVDAAKQDQAIPTRPAVDRYSWKYAAQRLLQVLNSFEES